MARTPDLDSHLLPVAAGLTDLEEARCPLDSMTRLRNGNPAPVIAPTAGFGDEIWVSHDGIPVAVGTYKGGELHPSRVFNL
jgi:tRNA pseudouridine55 synthase